MIADRFRGYLPVVVDVETAGFNHHKDALLEAAAVIIAMDDDGQLYTKSSITTHIHPFKDANLDQAALDFTGIDPFDPAREAIDEATALNTLFKVIRTEVKSANCKRAILVGHNASFDLNFLNAAVQRVQHKRNPFHPFSTFDTVTLAGLAFGQTVLAKACHEANIKFNNQEAHSALYDAKKTAELFCLIVNKWQILGGFQAEDSFGFQD